MILTCIDNVARKRSLTQSEERTLEDIMIAILIFDFLFLGQTCQPFRGGLQGIRQAVDDHAAVGIMQFKPG